MSVSLADTLNRKSEHICSKAPEELVQKFWETVVRRGKVFREDIIKQKYFPTDFEMLPKKQQLAINEWCHQIPVAGFNSGKYDLILIKKYFVTHVGGEKTVLLQKKQEKIMFLTTPNLKFFDIINYLGPGTSYKKWVKTYGSGQTKSWLPYEWFNSADKLDYEGLPPYRCWFSKLKNEFVLTLEEFNEGLCIFHERSMETFAHWLR